VTVRSDRMWLLCPKNESDLGDHFYDEGLFQSTMKKIQSFEDNPYQVVQKNDAVTFVISNIADVNEAIEYLKTLRNAEIAESEPV